jgi:outer membrane protein OmpA-like peptidoglycan-associated protein
MRFKTPYLCATVLSLLSLSSGAYAQTVGLSLDRFEPSERGSDWFANESLDLRGNLRPAIGAVGELAYLPLAIYGSDGGLRTPLVKYQLFAHVGASLVLADRFRFAFNLPIAAYATGTDGSLDGVTYKAPSGASLGDLRLSVDARILGEYGTPFTLAGGVQVWAPTGSRASFSGDEHIRLQPRLMASGDIEAFTYAARVGFTYRGLGDSIAGVAYGSELTFGVAAGVRLFDHKLTLGPELSAAATTEGGQLFYARTTPIEALFGAHYRVADDWHIGAGIGGGLTRGVGTPAARFLAAIEWAPAYNAPVLDRDGDGIVDSQDACPDVKGIKTEDPKTNGCPPPPPDRDGDGIIDAEDACPDVKGIKTGDPKTNGCPPPPPPPDRDGDGILDSEDACPDVKGERTQDPKTNGCPPDLDRDKDGVPNAEDACPDEAGDKTNDPKTNGCPRAVVKNDQIIILEQVQFATASATILPASDTILQALLKILKEHPEIKKLSVEGHTDDRGSAISNKQLSAARAASVVAWLTKHGVEKSRLTSAGFGLEKPIADNKTDEGRQKNRRVEFHIGK